MASLLSQSLFAVPIEMTSVKKPLSPRSFYDHFIPCHPLSRQPFSGISIIMILALLSHQPIFVSPSAEPVFIATRNGSTSSSKQNTDESVNRMTTAKMLSFDVSTAKDAAIALNSVQFMEMFVGTKNSADVNTYTQKHSAQKDCTSPATKAEIELSTDIEGIVSAETCSWNDIFGRRDNINIASGGAKSKSKDSSCPKYETVSEYVGRLWFLPDNKGGIKFRETVKVTSLSADGNSSTVECNTQYHNGSKWVDCSKIICRFLSIPSIRGGGDESSNSGGKFSQMGGEDKNTKVSMTLDCELLVWLPLPRAATKAVKKKISAVFENVAINFFEELASN